MRYRKIKNFINIDGYHSNYKFMYYIIFRINLIDEKMLRFIKKKMNFRKIKNFLHFVMGITAILNLCIILYLELI